MSSVPSATRTSIPQLMAEIEHLNATDLIEFQRRFAKWQQEHAGQTQEETALVQACKARLADDDEARLKALIAKSERGTLQAKDLQDYRRLARRAEKLEATRLAALTKLAQLWCKPVREVMDVIGWESEDEAPRHPKEGSRSRRQ